MFTPVSSCRNNETYGPKAFLHLNWNITWQFNAVQLLPVVCLPRAALISLEHLCCDNPSYPEAVSSTWEKCCPYVGVIRDSKSSSGLHCKWCCKPGAGSKQPMMEAEPQPTTDPPQTPVLSQLSPTCGRGKLAGPALAEAFHRVLSRPSLHTNQLKQHSCGADYKNRLQHRGLELFCLQGQRNSYDTGRLKNNQRSAGI